MRSGWSTLRAACWTASLLMLAAVSAPAADLDSPEGWRDGYKRLSALGHGFIVWESNRSGSWRLYYENLDGSGLRQLAPDEPGRDHLGPDISPDGSRVAYLSVPKGQPGEGKRSLHLISADGKRDRVLVDDARAFGGGRAVLWVTSTKLTFVGMDGHTYRLDLTTGDRERLTAEPQAEGGFLVNATKTYATLGYPAEFDPYDAATRQIARQSPQDGCEGYLTHDGVWGYWMGGAGGPINRFHLASRQISPIIEKDDPRMPEGRRYLYFPMVARSGRLFAFGASPNQHDHETSDYDIFVAQMDPKTLQLIGNPVRYTFDPHTDRYPDVFLADFELGRRQVEAPYAATFVAKALAGKTWAWDYGDGVKGSSATGKHTYRTPGAYRVTATNGGAVLRGEITVRPARAPRVLSCTVSGERDLAVVFDEPVATGHASIRLTSQLPITSSRLEKDERTLYVTAARKLAAEDTLLLAGITDRAQRPNAMALARLAVRPAAWPVNLTGLLFLWEGGDKPNTVRGAGGKSQACRVLPKGRARLNNLYAMRVSDGAYLADGADQALLAGCRQTNALTIEAVIRPDRPSQSGPARIVTFSTDPYNRDFTLGQEGDKLILRVRTPQTGDNGVNPELTLCTLPANAPTHVVVTYASGHVACYLNGQQVLESDAVQGDFSNWSPQHLLFGDEWTRDRDWDGTLERIALYNRALTADEARANAAAFARARSARRTVPRLEVEAKLLRRAPIPALKEIAPYTEGLVTFEYEITKRLSGQEKSQRILVVHWALQDREPTGIEQAAEGEATRLVLEPFDMNPQLQSLYRSELPVESTNLDEPLYYALSP